jgi:hypothetical protein
VDDQELAGSADELTESRLGSRRMAAVIALRPDTDRGREILDELEQQTQIRPEKVLGDGTRRYYLDAQDAGIDAFDPMLDKIDPDWRSHLLNWRGT